MVNQPDDLIRDEKILHLIARYQDGDQEAFVTLANFCSKIPWLHIKSKVAPDDAEDLFQEYRMALIVALLPGRAPVTGAGHLQALAITIAKRLVFNYYRREGKEQEKNEALLAKPVKETPDDVHLPLERKDLVTRLLLHSDLTDTQLDAVVSVYLMDQTKRKAASDLGIAEKSLSGRLKGAFLKFSDYLKKERNQ